jgi:hypothetical protein
MVFDATFRNISAVSWWQVLVVEENHRFCCGTICAYSYCCLFFISKSTHTKQLSIDFQPKVTSLNSNVWRAPVAQWVRKLDYLKTYTSLSPIRRGFTPCFVNYKKGCTRLADTKLLARDRWFSPGTPASSTVKDHLRICIRI